MKITFREINENDDYDERETEGHVNIIPGEDVEIEMVNVLADGGIEIVTNLPCDIRDSNMPYLILHLK